MTESGKRELENFLGYEIESYKIEEVFDNKNLIKINILIQPKVKIDTLNFKLLTSNEQSSRS
jgi:hypothetical protein